MNLTVIVGTFPHWRHLPTLARRGAGVFLFFDHRTSLDERAAAYRAALERFDVERVEPFAATPCPTDCGKGIHDWAQVRAGECCVALRCRACWLQVQVPVTVPTAATVHDTA